MENTVISTRIRLARNISGIPFTARLSDEKKRELCQTVKDAAMSLNDFNFSYIDAEKLTDIQAGSMIEDHMISPEFANSRNGRGILIDKKQGICIMINEEDHLRIQLLGSGEDLKRLYRLADKLDDLLNEKLHFAFDEKLGYLTHCPTNLGTGLRASYQLHLPALTESGLISKIINTVTQVGFTVRGLYGEGTRPGGCMYQVSNQVSLGISEQDTVDRLTEITEQITKNEAALREKMLENIAVADRIFRAYGVLKEARLLTSEEFLRLMSDVRLGIEGDLISLDMKKTDELFVKVQPYTLMLYNGSEFEARQRDAKRAEIVRSALK